MGEVASQKIIAIIPCFNTESFIGYVISKARNYVDQVIIIDDGSHDGTASIARDSGALVIPHEKNLGKGAAMRTAMKSADADIIVFLDGDGQHDPNDIPGVIAPIVQGKADFVIGSRYLSGSKASAPPFARRVTSVVASFVISIVISWLLPLSILLNRLIRPRKWQLDSTVPEAGAPKIKGRTRKLPGSRRWITDCTSGFRAIKKEGWQKLDLISPGFQIEAEMIYEAAKNGLFMAEVPISCNWNSRLSSLSIFHDGLRTLKLLAGKLAGDIVRKPRYPAFCGDIQTGG